MNRLIFVLTILIFLGSCTKQNTVSIDKLYILEYNYELNNKDSLPPFFKFKVCGYSELSKNLNLRYARRLLWDSPYFYDLNTKVPDSISTKIFTILSNYKRDTTFLYKGEGGRTYDGNAYRFIIQLDSVKQISIKFEPKFLPNDLKFLYAYLYGDREKTEHQSKYQDSFKMFESIVHDTLPPPPILNTIKFKPPVI